MTSSCSQRHNSDVPMSASTHTDNILMLKALCPSTSYFRKVAASSNTCSMHLTQSHRPSTSRLHNATIDTYSCNVHVTLLPLLVTRLCHSYLHGNRSIGVLSAWPRNPSWQSQASIQPEDARCQSEVVHCHTLCGGLGVLGSSQQQVVGGIQLQV